MVRITLQSLPQSTRSYTLGNAAFLQSDIARIGGAKFSGECAVIVLFLNKQQLAFIFKSNLQTWLHSYVKLFCEPCKKCGNHLLNTYPPTWRDLRTLEPLHEECK